MVDIDLERARRALMQLGTALDEVRGVIRFGPEATVRIKTDDKVINLPVSWAVAAAVAFVVAAGPSTGAGTSPPPPFRGALGPEPWRVAYVQPSRRPADGRYGENPNRLFKHYQFQVILKPSPDSIQDTYLKSLKAFGIDPADHDVRFEEDNWESPTLGAWGIGWQVLVDGLEITQFTYFQQAGGIDLMPISAEITYGLERIAAMIRNEDNIFDIEWTQGVPYGSVRLTEEQQFSRYSFESADVELHFQLLSQY